MPQARFLFQADPGLTTAYVTLYPVGSGAAYRFNRYPQEVWEGDSPQYSLPPPHPVLEGIVDDPFLMVQHADKPGLYRELAWPITLDCRLTDVRGAGSRIIHGAIDYEMAFDMLYRLDWSYRFGQPTSDHNLPSLALAYMRRIRLTLQGMWMNRGAGRWSVDAMWWCQGAADMGQILRNFQDTLPMTLDDARHS